MANDAVAAAEKPKIGVWESILIILSVLIFGLANTLPGLSIYARIYVAIGFVWILWSCGYLYAKTHLFARGISIDAHLSKTHLKTEIEKLQATDEKTYIIIEKETKNGSKPLQLSEIKAATLKTTVYHAQEALERGFLQKIDQPTIPTSNIRFINDQWLATLPG